MRELHGIERIYPATSSISQAHVMSATQAGAYAIRVLGAGED